jgi:hypothetical protein
VTDGCEKGGGNCSIKLIIDLGLFYCVLQHGLSFEFALLQNEHSLNIFGLDFGHLCGNVLKGNIQHKCSRNAEFGEHHTLSFSQRYMPKRIGLRIRYVYHSIEMNDLDHKF